MKKIIITLILVTLLTATAASNATAKLVEIQPEITIDIPDELDTPLEPAGEIQTIDVTIKFKLNISSQLAFIESFFTPDKRIGAAYIFGLNYFYVFKSAAEPIPNAQIELSLAEVPDMYSAQLENTTLEVNISSDVKEVKTKLHLSASEFAPAFSPEDLKIKAEFKNNEGYNIDASTVEKTMQIQADYIPLIDATKENGTYQMISPINITTVPITIHNYGNGKTKVKIYVADQPEKWNITIPAEATIDVDSEEQIMLEVEPYDEFKNEIITLKITPEYYENPGLKGNTTTIQFAFENDGSLDEEDNGVFGTPGFEVITLLAALAVALILIKKRKQ